MLLTVQSVPFLGFFNEAFGETPNSRAAKAKKKQQFRTQTERRSMGHDKPGDGAEKSHLAWSHLAGRRPLVECIYQEDARRP